MNIIECGPALVGVINEKPVAAISWRVDAPHEWYISYLYVSQPRLLPPLLARFRKIWRRSKPRLTFEYNPENPAMQKLFDLLQARQEGHLSIIDDLDRRK